MNRKYKEIFKLKKMLEEANIPFVFDEGGNVGLENVWYHICFPNNSKERLCSVVEGTGTYGNEADLLEIMGLLTPEESERDLVQGYLSAEEVFGRIRNAWLNMKFVSRLE